MARVKKAWIFFFVIVGMVGFVACESRGGAPSQAVGQPGAANQNAIVATPPAANDGSRSALDNVSRANVDQAEAQQQRVVLKSASLTLTVQDPKTKLDEINQMAEDMGGWVVDSTANTATSGSGDPIIQASTTIRVPAARLDEARGKIKNGAFTVQTDNITGQDVTQDYVDLNSHLTNLRAAETQLQTIMDRAQTTDDVLNVYNQLVNIRGQIETIQGQIQYYDQASAFSSIQVTLYPPPTQAQVEVAGWRPLDTAADALRLLVNALQFLVNVVIVVVIFVLPLALLFGVPAWFIRRFIRRRAKTPAPPARPDEP